VLKTSNFGDLYIETEVLIPENLNKEQKQLLEKFRSIQNNNENSEIKNFFNKAKKFWEKIDQ